MLLIGNAGLRLPRALDDQRRGRPVAPAAVGQSTKAWQRSNLRENGRAPGLDTTSTETAACHAMLRSCWAAANAGTISAAGVVGPRTLAETMPDEGEEPLVATQEPVAPGSPTTMGIGEFARLYELRAPHIMWFFGAGTSAAARVPTAGQMILDFRHLIYCSEHNMARDELELSDPVVQRRLELHFDEHPLYPPAGAPDEYSALFEAAYKQEADRQRYLRERVADAQPSYGHMVLAALMRLGKASAVFTTNFDQLVETAAAKVFGTTSALTVADLERHEVAGRALGQSDWPLLVKLHGDFRSRRLKNTSAELQRQDADLRQALLEGCRRLGLAVVGYSGRDDSVMDALVTALDAPDPYPQGLFWFHRHMEQPYRRVTELLEKAQAAGVDAYLVEIEAFDELMGQVRNLVQTPPDLAAALNDLRPTPRLAPSAVPQRGPKAFPAVRLNALPVLEMPRSARLLQCSLDNTMTVRDAIKEAGAKVVAAHRRDGVIAFGSDAEIHKAFDGHGLTEMGVAALEPDRFAQRDSADQGLCYDAFATALAHERCLVAIKRRRGHSLAVPTRRPDDPTLKPLRKALTGRLAGAIPDTPLQWSEAVRIRLEYRFDRCWLVFEPTVHIWGTADPSFEEARKTFVKEHQVRRYNPVWNNLLDAWSEVLVAGHAPAELRAFGTGAGMDATFRLGHKTAFCWSQHP